MKEKEKPHKRSRFSLHHAPSKELSVAKPTYEVTCKTSYYTYSDISNARIIILFKIRKFNHMKGGVAECRWGMGRDSGKCLHELDVLCLCGKPHIPVVVGDREQLQGWCKQNLCWVFRTLILSYIWHILKSVSPKQFYPVIVRRIGLCIVNSLKEFLEMKFVPCYFIGCDEECCEEICLWKPKRWWISNGR